MEDPAPAIPIDRLLAHREWVRRVARALVGDESLADDLEQSVWLEALRRPPRSQGSLGGWLAAAMRNNLTDLRRSERRRRVREEAVARPEAERSAADVVAEAELLKRVVAAVLDLPEPNRGTLLLRFFDDLPLKEVARRQSIPLETVRTRLRTALRSLRERFDAENRGDRTEWCVAFAPLLRKPVPPIAGIGATAASVTGVLLMGTKAKALVVVAALLAGVGVLWFASEDGGVPPEIGQVATLPPREVPSRPAASQVAAIPSEKAGSGVLEVAVRDWEGKPVPDAKAAVAPWVPSVEGQIWAKSDPGTFRETRTGAEGNARIEGLEAYRDYDLSVSATGRGRVSRMFQITDTTKPLALTVTLLVECRLTGRVVDDAGAPVPGAVVDVYGTGEVRVGRGTADPTGRYRVAGLPHGLVSVMVARPGEVAAFSPVEARAVGTRVRLPFDRDLDLVLGASARISGTVTDAITGRPIGNAVVRMFANGVHAAGGPAVTDVAGRYLITNLRDGIVDDIQVAVPGYNRSPIRRGGTGPRRFAVRAGSTVTCDIALEPATEPEPGGGQPGGAIEGHVRGPGGGLVAGARVGSVKAGPDGRFRIEGAPAGTVSTWIVEAPGYARAELRAAAPPHGEVLTQDVTLDRAPRVHGSVTVPGGVPVPEGTTLRFQVIPDAAGHASDDTRHYLWGSALAGSDGHYEGELPWAGAGRLRVSVNADGYPVGQSAAIDLSPGVADYEVDVALQAGGSLSGRVLDAETGKPLQGARILMGGNVVSTTNALGEFEVRGLPAAAKLLEAEVAAPAYAPFRTLRFRGWSIGDDIVVRLNPLKAIAGIVTWGTGGPAVGAVVQANRGLQHASAGDDGRFLLRGIPAGGHRIEVEHPDGCRVVVDGVQAGTTDLAIVMEKGASASGRVVDADRRGVPGAAIYAVPVGKQEPVHRLATGSDGYFVMAGLEPGAEFSLNVVPPTRPSAEFPAPERYVSMRVPSLRAGDQDVEIRLKEGLAIEGVLVDELGAPLAGAALAAVDGRGGEARVATTDPQGQFALRGLQPGSYEVRQAAKQGGVLVAAVRGGEVIAAGTGDVRLVGTLGAILRGIVMDEQGNPVRDAKVEVEGIGSTGTTSINGSFELRNLPPGGVALWIDARGFVPRAVPDARPSGDSLRITVFRGLEVFGRVIRTDGTPLRASVVFRHPEDPRLGRQTWADDQGRFRASGLVDSPFIVTVVVSPSESAEIGRLTPGTGVEVELKLPQ